MSDEMADLILSAIQKLTEEVERLRRAVEDGDRDIIAAVDNVAANLP